jgi:hypothetical protein
MNKEIGMMISQVFSTRGYFWEKYFLILFIQDLLLWQLVKLNIILNDCI